MLLSPAAADVATQLIERGVALRRNSIVHIISARIICADAIRLRAWGRVIFSKRSTSPSTTAHSSPSQSTHTHDFDFRCSQQSAPALAVPRAEGVPR